MKGRTGHFELEMSKRESFGVNKRITFRTHSIHGKLMKVKQSRVSLNLLVVHCISLIELVD